MTVNFIERFSKNRQVLSFLNMLPARAELFLERRLTDLKKGTRLKITEDFLGNKTSFLFLIQDNNFIPLFSVKQIVTLIV
jgi:hypothetical protein